MCCTQSKIIFLLRIWYLWRFSRGKWWNINIYYCTEYTCKEFFLIFSLLFPVTCFANHAYNWCIFLDTNNICIYTCLFGFATGSGNYFIYLICSCSYQLWWNCGALILSLVPHKWHFPCCIQLPSLREKLFVNLQIEFGNSPSMG